MRLPIEKDGKKNENKIVEIDIFSINHLPIVKEFAQRIGLVEVVNQFVPSQMDVEPGIMVLGLVLDTLSGRTPLYRLPTFFEDYDAELLLGKEISPGVFADHNVGRLMDKIYEAGSLRLFSEIARRAVVFFGVNTRHVSFDTTSISVFGEYGLCSKDASNPPFVIDHGHSKDHRPDLKQFLISMLCVDRNIPIFGKPEDGNGSDKRINNETLSMVSKHMATHGLNPGAFIYIADSALITEANLAKMGDDIQFISRLPATYNECGRAIKEATDKDDWKEAGVLAITQPTAKRPAAFYKTYETEVVLYGRKYRAVVVHSSSHDKRRQKKIERELKKERKQLERKVKEALKTEYFCQADAMQALAELKKNTGTYHRLQAETVERPKYKRGRPKAGKAPEVKEMRYGINAVVEEDKESVQRLREESGCFVLISNVPETFGGETYDGKTILSAYKDQHGIEQNFGFLKDPVIVHSIFLEKAERIEVLGLIFLLALLIWRLIEHSMRNYIEKTGEDLPGWEKRRTKRPTSFMLKTKFSGIYVAKIGRERELSKPLNSEQLEYLKALGIDPLVFIDPRPG